MAVRTDRRPRFAVTCRTCGKVLCSGEVLAGYAKKVIDEHTCPRPDGAQDTIVGP